MDSFIQRHFLMASPLDLDLSLETINATHQINWNNIDPFNTPSPCVNEHFNLHLHHHPSPNHFQFNHHENGSDENVEALFYPIIPLPQFDHTYHNNYNNYTHFQNNSILFTSDSDSSSFNHHEPFTNSSTSTPPLRFELAQILHHEPHSEIPSSPLVAEGVVKKSLNSTFSSFSSSSSSSSSSSAFFFATAAPTTTTTTTKKICDSRLSLNQLSFVLGLNGNVNETATREKLILSVFKDDLNFPLGTKTWIRDTPPEERKDLINNLHLMCESKFKFGYKRDVYYTIIRRASYSLMQGRLRRERRSRRKNFN